MKTAAAIILLASLSTSETPQNPKPDYPQTAMLCFKTGERQSGMNKICYYNCGGSEAAITVGAIEICPLSINQ